MTLLKYILAFSAFWALPDEVLASGARPTPAQQEQLKALYKVDNSKEGASQKVTLSTGDSFDLKTGQIKKKEAPQAPTKKANPKVKYLGPAVSQPIAPSVDVELKTGTMVKGKMHHWDNDRIQIDAGVGVPVTYLWDQIKSINKMDPKDYIANISQN